MKPLDETDLKTRTARRRLARGVYWYRIADGVHLGYRRGVQDATWLVRWRHVAGYRRADVGKADDDLAEGSLDFNSAEARARGIVAEVYRERARGESPELPVTVEVAVKEYIAQRDARASRRAGRSINSDASRRLGKYVSGHPERGSRKAVPAAPLAAIALDRLTERDLISWRETLAGVKESTRQRLINDLKAALNGAYAARRDVLPPSFPQTVKFGLRALGDTDESEPVARDNQILSTSEVARVLEAARTVDARLRMSGDLYRVVLLLAATGARFSQVVRMRVGDVQRDQMRVLVPVSRKGKGNKAFTVPVPVGVDVLDALKPATEGRADEAVLLERWRSVQVSGGKWVPDTRGPWLDSSELRRPWLMIREEAELPDAIPYALRHSSIVRGIRAGLPIRLVAALHDTSTAMIEKHYSRWITSGLEDLARAAIVPLS